MAPTHEYYSEDRKMVTLTKNWAIAIIGKEHFESPSQPPQHILCPKNEIAERGVKFGLRMEVLAWLLSTRDTVTLPASLFSGVISEGVSRLGECSCWLIWFVADKFPVILTTWGVDDFDMFRILASLQG
jgi:hypothetical protein